jgi:hypothetical protein
MPGLLSTKPGRASKLVTVLAVATAAAALGLLILLVLRGARGRGRRASERRAGAAAACSAPWSPPSSAAVAWDMQLNTQTLTRDGAQIPLKELTVDDGNGGGDAWVVAVKGERLDAEIGDSVQVVGDVTVSDEPQGADDAATVAYLGRATGFIPKGMIIAWADHTKAPGGNWQPCDGQGGRPNLAGRYLKGVGAEADAGKLGGENMQPLNESHLPNHTHTLGDAISPTGSGSPLLTQPSTTCAVVAGVWTGAAARGGTPSATAMKIAGRAVSTCDDWDALTPNWRSDPNHAMIASVTTEAGAGASEVFLDHTHGIEPDGQADAKADVRPRSVWVGYYIST